MKGIEIIEKIKEKKLSQEEALAVVADDKNLRYKRIKADKRQLELFPEEGIQEPEE